MVPESIEKTFVMVKPDGVKRGLTGKLFKRFEQIGLKLVACRMILPTEEQARGNYPGTEEWIRNLGEKTIKNYNNDLEKVKKDIGTTDSYGLGQKVYDGLVKYLTSGPVILSVWEGNHAISIVRKLAGATLPELAAPGTIRGDFSFDSPMLAISSGRLAFQTVVHISDSTEEAQREIQHWFKDTFKDLGNYTRVDYTGSFEAFE